MSFENMDDYFEELDYIDVQDFVEHLDEVCDDEC